MPQVTELGDIIGIWTQANHSLCSRLCWKVYGLYLGTNHVLNEVDMKEYT